MSKVRILYDFVAEDSNELNAKTGEELFVMNTTLYDGWIQVKNKNGSIGIVPSTYVEYINDDDDIPPPPFAYEPTGGNSTWNSTPAWNTPAPTSSYVNAPTFSNTYQNQTNNQAQPNQYQNFDTSIFDPLGGSPNITETNVFSSNTSTTMTNTSSYDNFNLPTSTNSNTIFDFGNPSLSPNSPSSHYSPPPLLPATQPNGDTWNSPSYTSNVASATAAASNTHGKVNRNYDDDSDDFSEDEAPRNSNAANPSGIGRTSNILNNTTLNTNSTGTISKSKSKNPYSLEAFLLHGAIKSVHDSDRFSSILQNEQRQSVWKRTSPPYQVQILGYQSDKKYHGVKKFTSYEIKANIFPQRVKRRYNHFDWLHERLTEKFPNICIPALSGKAVTGNFDDDFIAKRKALLELWLNRMSAHPVIGQSEVFIHFLQCDDASAKWKQGKRKAEKDEHHGAQWFCTLTVPGESVDTTTGIKERVDKFSKSATNLNYCIKNVSTSLERVNYNNSVNKKDLSNLGKRLEEMGTTLSNESLDAPNNSKLSTAFVSAGNVFNQIGNMYGEQSKHDVNPLLDHLQLYQGILQQMPDIVQIEKSAIQLYEEFAAKPEKLEGRSLMEVAPRREIISHVTFAEINQFNRDKVDDLAVYMKSFLKEQIQFYTQITDCLKRAYSEFEKIPVSAASAAGAFPAGGQNQSFKK